MKSKKMLIFVTLAVVTMLPLAVSAQEALSADRIAAVRSNCSVITINLLQLQRRDLVARTNRGRAYEAILKQMEAFRDRVNHNKLAVAQFDAPLTAFEQSANDFRASYIRYDDKLIDLRDINCREKPEEFITGLEELRVMRAETAAAINRADQALVEYRAAAVTLQQQLMPIQRTNQ